MLRIRSLISLIFWGIVLYFISHYYLGDIISALQSNPLIHQATIQENSKIIYYEKS